MKLDNKGITLVALVITIIIILILSGIAIYFSVGENGLIKISKEAAKKYQNAANNELMQLNMIDGNLANNGLVNDNNENEDNSKKREVVLLEANCSSRYTKTISVAHIQGYKNFTEDNFFEVLRGMYVAGGSDKDVIRDFEKSYNRETGELTLSMCKTYTNTGNIIYNVYDVYLLK